jgi:putative oligomerization/nucleic acid binding protein
VGLIGGIARTAVAAGTWTAVSNSVSRRQAGRWAAEDQSAHPGGYVPPPPGRYQRPMFQQQPQAHAAPTYQAAPDQPPPAIDMSARLAQLQQLGALKTQGILSEAEFEAQKRKILDT